MTDQPKPPQQPESRSAMTRRLMREEKYDPSPEPIDRQVR